MQAKETTETFDFIIKQAKAKVFSAVAKALAKNLDQIVKECCLNNVFLNTNKYPQEEYVKIKNTTTRTYYWIHKNCGEKLHSLEQLLHHVKTSCISPPYQLANFSQNAFPKYKDFSVVFAITSLVYAKNYQSVENLTDSDLDEILWLGQYRCASLNLTANKNSASFDDFMGRFLCEDPNFCAHVSKKSSEDEVELKGDLSNGKGPLFHALEVFLDSESVLDAIITIGDQSAALFRCKEGKYIYLFYPQPTNQHGKVAKVSKLGQHSSCLKRFPLETLEVLQNDLYFNLLFKPQGVTDCIHNPYRFKITLVEVQIKNV